MKLHSSITLACLVALPLAGVVTAQANNTRGTERAAQEAARAQEEARAKAQEQTQRARDEAARREREAKGSRPDARDEKSAAEKNPRAVANEIAKLEALHRERMARINRLMDVYRESNNVERLKELEALREAQRKRYENARARLKERAGAAEFERIDNKLAPGRKPGAKRERRDGNADERAAAERQARERQEKERIENARKEAEAREKREKNAREKQKEKDGGGR